MALLEEAARQLYREWFVRLRFPGHEHTRITNGVPEGWDDCRVSNFGQVITGKTPSTKEADNYGGDIPFIKTPDMHGNVFVVPPTFDHAWSLGRELVDDSAGKCRGRLLAEGRLAQYAEKAPGAIFWQVTDKHGISPLELVRRAAGLHPELFAPALKRLEKLHRARLHMIVGRVPEDWMSELARDFAVELMCYTLDQLKKVTP